MATTPSCWPPGAIVRFGGFSYVAATDGQLVPIAEPAVARPLLPAGIHAAADPDVHAPGTLLRLGSMNFITTAAGTAERVGAPTPPPAASDDNSAKGGSQAPPTAENLLPTGPAVTGGEEPREGPPLPLDGAGGDVDATAEALAELELCPEGAFSPESPRLLDLDNGALWRQLNTSLGRQPTKEDLRAAFFSFANVTHQLAGGPPIPPLAQEEGHVVYPFGLANAAQAMQGLLEQHYTPVPDDEGQVAMVDYTLQSPRGLLEEDDFNPDEDDLLGDDTVLASEESSNVASYHPSRECFMANHDDDGRLTISSDDPPA